MESSYGPKPHPASLSYPKYSIMKLITFFGTGIFVILAACCMQKESADQQLSLYDRKWDLKKIHTNSGTESTNTKAFIRFNKEKGSAGGNGSCNTFGSNATIDGNKISFTNIFSTKMFCEGVQSTEDSYFKNLGEVNRFEISNNVLLLYHDKDVLLEFTGE